MRKQVYVIALLTLILSLCFMSASAAGADWALRVDGAKAPVLLPDGGVAVISGSKVVAVNADGNMKWSWDAGGQVKFLATDDAGNLYAALSKTVFKVSGAGKMIWKTDAFGEVYSFAFVEGKLLVGWANGLFELDDKGKLLWEYYMLEDC